MTLIIVTGASRGFGRELCLQLAPTYPKGANFYLIGRHEESLQQTIKECRRVNLRCLFTAFLMDLQDTQALEERVQSLIQEWCELKPYSSVMLFNNAGSLGTLDRLVKPLLSYKPSTLKTLMDTVNSNLTSTIYLTTHLLNGLTDDTKVTVVNVSSLAALKAFDCWSMYSTCKAARDMFHASLALENPQWRVLNYAPGPLDTEMQAEIRDKMPDVPLKQQFVQMFTDKKLVSLKDSVGKLMQLLQDNTFKSGTHIDFYDEHPIIKKE